MPTGSGDVSEVSNDIKLTSQGTVPKSENSKNRENEIKDIQKIKVSGKGDEEDPVSEKTKTENKGSVGRTKLDNRSCSEQSVKEESVFVPSLPKILSTSENDLEMKMESPSTTGPNQEVDKVLMSTDNEKFEQKFEDENSLSHEIIARKTLPSIQSKSCGVDSEVDNRSTETKEKITEPKILNDIKYTDRESEELKTDIIVLCTSKFKSTVNAFSLRLAKAGFKNKVHTIDDESFDNDAVRRKKTAVVCLDAGTNASMSKVCWVFLYFK